MKFLQAFVNWLNKDQQKHRQEKIAALQAQRAAIERQRTVLQKATQATQVTILDMEAKLHELNKRIVQAGGVPVAVPLMKDIKSAENDGVTHLNLGNTVEEINASTKNIERNTAKLAERFKLYKRSA